MIAHKELPATFDAEQALLGSILVNNAAYHSVSEILKPHDFADPLHGRIYETVEKLIDRGQLCNLFSLKTFFENDPDMAKAGGVPYLAKLMAASVHAHDAKGTAKLIWDASMRRTIIGLASNAMAKAYDPSPTETATQQIEGLERGLYELAEKGTEGGFLPFAANLTTAIKTMEAAHTRGTAGISTGFKSLDGLLGGFQPSDLIVLAARPGMGKSALASNIAQYAAMRYRKDADSSVEGCPVGFFSLEMSGSQIVTRMLAEHVGVSSNLIRTGKMNSKQADSMIEAASLMESLPFYIDDTAGLTISALRSRARRLKRQHGIGLFVVDYLQLVEAGNRKDGRVQEVSEITRGLKTLAKELNVPVLALSQLSRKVEDRTDKRPQLADLRDSGTIEQDADVVMFIYREEYYDERKNDQGAMATNAGKTEVHIAKHRHGPTGIAHMLFNGMTTKFRDAPEEVKEAKPTKRFSMGDDS